MDSFELDAGIPVNTALVYVRPTEPDALTPHPDSSVVTGATQDEATAQAEQVASDFILPPHNGYLAQVFVPGKQFKNATP